VDPQHHGAERLVPPPVESNPGRAAHRQPGRRFPEGLADGALDRVAAQALGPRVAAALSQLSPIYRDALLLHVWGELSYEQVAEATHVSVGTVRSRIHRARSYVRAALRPEEILK
jgi:RNA polymerase sigma factor (sigma-70 family)